MAASLIGCLSATDFAATSPGLEVLRMPQSKANPTAILKALYEIQHFFSHNHKGMNSATANPVAQNAATVM